MTKSLENWKPRQIFSGQKKRRCKMWCSKHINASASRNKEKWNSQKQKNNITHAQFIHRVSKTLGHQLMAITSSELNQFLKFFHAGKRVKFSIKVTWYSRAHLLLELVIKFFSVTRSIYDESGIIQFPSTRFCWRELDCKFVYSFHNGFWRYIGCSIGGLA